MRSISRIIVVSIFIFGLMFVFLSYNIFSQLTLFKMKTKENKMQKFYVVNEERAQNIYNRFDNEKENEEEFNIFKFFERLNGDFNFEY